MKPQILGNTWVKRHRTDCFPVEEAFHAEYVHFKKKKVLFGLVKADSHQPRPSVCLKFLPAKRKFYFTTVAHGGMSDLC